MIEDFVAFDFETSYGHIPCSIGIVEFINGKPVHEYYSLIKPIDLKFSSINSRINGLYLEDVENEREFDEVWKEISKFFENKNLVAHNASTDISILEKTLLHYGIASPIYKTYCTLSISRATIKLNNYKLSTVAEYFKINQVNYHNALDDALVCGNLFCNLINNAFEYHASTRKRIRTIPEPRDFLDKPKIVYNVEKFIEKTFLFTGRLVLFSRAEAEEMVEKNGGKNISAVSKNLNYLVVGEKAGSKLKKAQAIETITILDEQEFLDLLK